MRRLVSLLIALGLAASLPVPASAQAPTEYPCGDQVWPVGLGGNRPVAGSLPVLFVHGINSNPGGTWNRRDALMKAVTGSKPVKGWTFDYSQWSTNWVTNPHIGPALAEAITCLSRTSGHQVVVVAHSMGGLATQFAVGQRTPDTRQPVSDLVAKLITVGTPYRGSKTLSQTKQGLRGSVALNLISKACSAWTAGGEEKCWASLSLPNTEVGTALEYGSDEIGALPPWPKDLPVLPIATDIEYFLGLRMFGAGKTYHLGDLIVTIDSQTAHSNAAAPDIKTCDDTSIMDMARTVLGSEETTCYHLTQLNRPDIHRRIGEVVAGFAKNPPAPRQPRPCDTADEAALNHAHPLSDGVRYLKIDCRDRYVLASANTIPRTVWEQWGEVCEQEPVPCGTVSTPNGDQVVVTAMSSGVSCELARDIVTRYYRHVREHGQGSGGHLTIDGWICGSRTAADQERTGMLGSCVKGTDWLQMSRP